MGSEPLAVASRYADGACSALTLTINCDSETIQFTAPQFMSIQTFISPDPSPSATVDVKIGSERQVPAPALCISGPFVLYRATVPQQKCKECTYMTPDKLKCTF